MRYGAELIASLEDEMRILQDSLEERSKRIDRGDTDWDDCFVSERVESRGVSLCREKIALIKDGGCAWFRELATLDGELVNYRWCETVYGSSMRVEMPDGAVVWTSALTAKGLARKGLKWVECLRPAWYCFRSSGRGMCGVYGGSYVLFPSDFNYATGEDASVDPMAIRDV